jgi:hypothetical protein
MTMTSDRPARQTFPSIVSFAETYECPACESAISPACVRRHDPTDAETLRNLRRLTAYCRCCERAFQATLVFDGGQLRQIAEVSVITDEAEINLLKAGLAAVNGDRQVRRAEPSKAAVRHEPDPRLEEMLGRLDEMVGLHQTVDRSEREILAARGRMREVVRQCVTDRRVPPRAEEAADVERLDTDCDQAAARIRQTLADEGGRVIPAPGTPQGFGVRHGGTVPENVARLDLDGDPIGSRHKPAERAAADAARDARHAEQVRQIDASTDQRSDWERTEPGRDFAE